NIIFEIGLNPLVLLPCILSYLLFQLFSKQLIKRVLLQGSQSNGISAQKANSSAAGPAHSRLLERKKPFEEIIVVSAAHKIVHDNRQRIDIEEKILWQAL